MGFRIPGDTGGLGFLVNPLWYVILGDVGGLHTNVFYIFCPVDIFSSAVWHESDKMEDPELQELAKLLPNVVLQSRAPATVKKYTGAFLRWKNWAMQKCSEPCFPARALQVALYLAYLIQKSSTSSPVEEAVNAISWAHQVAVAEDPTKSDLVKQVLAGAKRILAHRSSKKEPITPEILAQLVDRFAGDDADLADVRLISLCLVGFAGFLRFNELATLKESDLHIFEDHMEIFIEASKTDQFRDGAWVTIARTGTKTCPVHMAERYIKLGEISGSPDLHLYRGIVRTKNGVRLRKQGGLSYTRMRELLLEKLVEVGLDPKNFGLHSLRAGGATAAANAGVPDRLFKRHGRWRSENAKDGYVKDSLSNRLSVTKRIGL